ncbi:hypothetical protein F5X96DRAFT_194401 [Biscogniauxia mediterranea]|nr:hypothetical protein F5X96DRAFT_194401 [Biscogniauxia mediterranea]
MRLPNTMTSGFQFITSINTVARDEETRRKVRSHARRQKLPSDTSPAQSKKSGTQKDRTSKFRLKSTPPSSNASRKTSTVLKVQRVTQDPDKKPNFETSMLTKELAITVARELPTFSMLRIETTPLTENLLKYCLTVCLCPRETMVEKWFDRAGAPTYLNTYYSGFLANAFAMNPQGGWFESIQVDAAASHAFLAMVAAMHNSLAMWDDTSTFDFHRLQAIKYVNERLNLEGKSQETPVSDGVIVAVALLVNNETFTGSITAAAAHMNGLKRMVDLRGGLIEGFKHSTMLQRAIAWADFSYASVASEPLMFPFVAQLASSLNLHDRFQSRSLVANMETHGPSDLTIHNREVVEVLELMHSITDCLNAFDYMNLAAMSTERVQVSDSIYLVEWRLCKLEEASRLQQSPRRGSLLLLTPTEDDRQLEYPSHTDISDILIYAAHLFLHLALRGQPPAAQRHRALTEALMSALCDPLLALDLLSAPEPYASPKSFYSGCSAGNNSSENRHPTTPALPSYNVAPTEPKDELHADILLWSLFVGSCVRVPISRNESPFTYQAIKLGHHHEFFIHALRNCCRMRGIKDKGTLTEKLKNIMWLDSWCEHQLDLIWMEIGDQLAP